MSEQQKERRKDNLVTYECLSAIKGHLYDLNEVVVRIQTRQENILEYIDENKLIIKDVLEQINSCPFEQEFKEIHNQCLLCKGAKNTWNSMPVIVQLVISVLTILFIFYKGK